MDYEIKMNYRFNGQLTDKEFNVTIQSVVNYAEKQLSNKKPSIVFKKANAYYEELNYIASLIHKYNAYYYSVSKWSLVDSVITMIIRMPTPNMRKKVLNYLNSQIAAYCYSKRPYANQIPNYPYKSTNIVDLLEEVEQVRQARVSVGISR